jgi:hypothetical protein
MSRTLRDEQVQDTGAGIRGALLREIEDREKREEPAFDFWDSWEERGRRAERFDIAWEREQH